MKGVSAERATVAFAFVAAVFTLALYATGAIALIEYPWDWSPDEGLSLDYGRRALEAPETLYTRTAVPFPSAYGPLFPFLLAPVLAFWREPLAGARVLAFGWTMFGALGVYALVRKTGPPVLALACAALALAAMDLSVWHMFVRVDGLMIALWLLASIPLFPARLERGADRLSSGRIAAGTVLMLAAILTKPTAAVHAAPLIAAWFFVDRKGALRLWVALGVSGLVAFGLLQWLTDGAFLWVSRLWGLHASVPGLRREIVVYFLERAWPMFLPALVVLAIGGKGSRLARDPSWLLLAGCMAVIPLMSKQGASWNYALPTLAALAVLAGRWWAMTPVFPRVRGLPGPLVGAALIAALGASLAATHEFPLPAEDDERTSRALYSYVADYVSEVGGPILATRPDLAYFLVGQPVEAEGSSFGHLVSAGAPGTGKVLSRLQQGEYTLVIETWPYPESGGYREAIARGYAHAGGCTVRYYFGSVSVHLFARRDLYRSIGQRPGGRCGTGAPPTDEASPEAGG